VEKGQVVASFGGLFWQLLEEVRKITRISRREVGVPAEI
jgi:hypothetical protein